jgi:hypothetical protein
MNQAINYIGNSIDIFISIQFLITWMGCGCFPVAVYTGVVFLPQKRRGNANTHRKDFIFRSHFFL